MEGEYRYVRVNITLDSNYLLGKQKYPKDLLVAKPLLEVFKGQDPKSWKKASSTKDDYSWIADQRDAYKKMIFRRTRRVTTFSRPLLESSRQGESRSIRTILFDNFLSS